MNEKIKRATTCIVALNASSEFSHKVRLRFAGKLQRVIDAFIAEEVDKATSKEHCVHHLSWTEIGQALQIPKGTAYNRYGKKRGSEDK